MITRGPSSPAFVAEVSSNHHGDLSRCFQFIETAAQLGCDAVKFQLFRVSELFAPEILAASQTHRNRVAWELPLGFIKDLADCCSSQQITFACTPFYLRAVEELFPYVGLYKIASYELLWGDLLRACAATGKPVVFSTGMATLDEVRLAVDLLRKAGCEDLTLLHCVSGYPAPVEDCNLSAIETLRDCCGCQVGWSDHTVDAAVIYRAIHRWRAELIELHLDLDGAGAEFGGGHCWMPDQIRPVIESVRRSFAADGNGVKEPAACEIADRDWRTDPLDGLRPLIRRRTIWRQECAQ